MDFDVNQFYISGKYADKYGLLIFGCFSINVTLP